MEAIWGIFTTIFTTIALIVLFVVAGILVARASSATIRKTYSGEPYAVKIQQGVDPIRFAAVQPGATVAARIYSRGPSEPPLRETVPNLYVYADERTFRQRAAGSRTHTSSTPLCALGRHVHVKCALARAAEDLGVHGAGK
jgi:hypothetical protein